MEKLSITSLRRFGAEIEINAFDLLNRPLGYSEGKLPAGIHYVGNLVHKTTNSNVTIHKWGNDHYNDNWVIKPDASCGMEVCTPVLKGWKGVLEVCRVVDAFKNDSKITADSRCSFHVHVDVSNLSEEQLAAVLSWWIKCEPVFMDSVPYGRKKNQYCQFIGLTDLLNVEDGLLYPSGLISRLGACKYYTINTYHYVNKKRKTIEFRIMESQCCRNSLMAKNWIRLLLHFVEMAVKNGLPSDYTKGDKWSGYCWLDPNDVFEFLGFDDEISDGLQQIRDWFINRLVQNVVDIKDGIFSSIGRSFAINEICDLRKKFESVNLDFEDEIYSNKFRI